MVNIEEQIQFIKSEWRKSSSDLSDMYTSILETLMKAKERQDELNAEPMLEIFIDKIRTSLLKIDGFIRGRFDDAYSGAKNRPIYYKRLGNDDYNQYWTAIITKNEIAIEIEYDYGGGYSGGVWEFTENDAKSFVEAYKQMIEKIRQAELTPLKFKD